jgi:hypothetical protein
LPHFVAEFARDPSIARPADAILYALGICSNSTVCAMGLEGIVSKRLTAPLGLGSLGSFRIYGVVIFYSPSVG